MQPAARDDVTAGERPPDPWRAAPRYQPLVPVAVALALGIAADRGWPCAAWLWWSLAVAMLAVWGVAWRLGWQRRGAVALLAATLCLGGAWHHASWHLFPPDDLGLCVHEEPQPMALAGVAGESPRFIPEPPFDPMRAIPASERSRLSFWVTSVREGRQWRPASGWLRLDVDGQLEGVRAGDQLQVFVHASAPREPASDGQFDYAADRRAYRMLTLARCEFPQSVSVTEPSSGWSPRTWLDGLRAGGDRLLWRHLTATRSGLAAALLLGIHEELDAERTETYLETGTVHILSISGLHVGILAAALFAGLRFGLLPRRPALVAVTLVVTLYALVANAEAPVVRAAILVACLCGGLAIYRRVLAFNTLAAAGILVLAVNPADLFRVGPQLSFLSVATLTMLSPWLSAWSEQDNLDRLIARTRSWPERAFRWLLVWAWRITAASLVVWLVTLPVIMAHYHLVSPVAVPLNAVLWLPVALALWSGFALLAVGWLAPPLAWVLGAACDTGLYLMDAIVAISAQLPGSHFWVAAPALWWMAGLYLALTVWASGLRVWLPHRWAATLVVVWAACGLWLSAGRPADQLTCSFLSVGHGSAVVLELPDGQTVLYDAGQLGSPISGARTVAGRLWARGITRLDAVIISHADVDHYNALPELFRRFDVGVVYVTPMFREGDSPAVAALVAAIERHGIPVRELAAGDALQAGNDCRLEVRHPTAIGVPGSDNANSLVLAVECFGRRILLTGDLESPGIESLLEDEPYDCDVLAAPHHGSRFSDPPGLAAWSRPEWVVVSCGYGDDPELVTQAYGARGAHVLSTVDSGSVTVEIDRRDLRVTSWR